ncbi:MAG TPA: beta-propeller domain-containing protein, partial [Gammaproteobacteria bacterium]
MRTRTTGRSMIRDGLIYHLLIILMVLLVLAGCGGSGGNGPAGDDGPIGDGPTADGLLKTPPGELQLKSSTSCEAVTDYVADSIAELILHSGLNVCPDCLRTAAGLPLVEVADAAAPVPATAAGRAGDGARFADVTGTNTQESGVDELDIIEADADGNFYLIDGRHLVVAKGAPPKDLSELASIDLDGIGQPQGLLLDETNDRLVVVLSGDALFGPAVFAPDIWLPPIVRLLFVDVSDPADPVITRRLSIDGYRIAARRIGSRVHLVSHFTPFMPAAITDSQELNDLRQQYFDAAAGGPGDADALAQSIRDTVAALVAATDSSDYVPEIWQQDGETDAVLLDDPTCADIATPDVSMPFALTMVTSVDTDGSNVGRLAIANNAWNVYASEENLYLMQTSAGWWWDRRQAQQTAIFKVRIGSGLPAFESLGLVDGWAASSYQFSEHDGFLRVATNRWEIDPATDRFLQHNNLYVLA